MQKNISLKLLPSESADEETVKKYISASLGKPINSVKGFNILKRSIDARKKTIYINLSLQAFIDEPPLPLEHKIIHHPDVSRSVSRVVVIGAGPAGLFAALKLVEEGTKPIIIERGKDVRARRRDLASLNKDGILNSESNYCFGEGGAGTYSDGKLYTRSSKRGSIERILNLFVQFGAPDNILSDAHPHIGTNKLPQIITAMRKQLEDSGAEFHFEKKLVDLEIKNGKIIAAVTADSDRIEADAFILATGHSARDIFTLLQRLKLRIEAKPFALGIRIEHPQHLIDHIQYHGDSSNNFLPPASYSLVEQVKGTGVFSFCMCPGGIIAPASTDQGELVVNGWSPSKRNNPFANSGMVVQVSEKDAWNILKVNKEANHDSVLKEEDPLLLLKFQQLVEQKAFVAGGGKFKAPAQRMADFVNKKESASLPDNSYLPGLSGADLSSVLPKYIYNSLSGAFVAFGKKMKGYLTNDAIVVATESRTSSPVRIPRDRELLSHPQLENLYPCGEGAGYAGGIVSAAMDGERVASVIYERLKSKK